MKRIKRVERPLNAISFPNHSNQTSKSLLEKWKADVDEYIKKYGDPTLFPFEGDGFKKKREAALNCREYIADLNQYVEARYGLWLSIKKRTGILKWQWKLIKKRPNLKRVFELFDYIKQHTIPYHEGIQIAEARKIPKFKTEKGQDKDYVLFTPDYNQMELKFDLKRRQIHRYLRAFSRTESQILVDFGKMGPRKNKIYGVGYWAFFEDKSQKRMRRRRNFFLKNSPSVRKDLMHLKL